MKAFLIACALAATVDASKRLVLCAGSTGTGGTSAGSTLSVTTMCSSFNSIGFQYYTLHGQTFTLYNSISDCNAGKSVSTTVIANGGVCTPVTLTNGIAQLALIETDCYPKDCTSDPCIGKAPCDGTVIGDATCMTNQVTKTCMNKCYMNTANQCTAEEKLHCSTTECSGVVAALASMASGSLSIVILLVLCSCAIIIAVIAGVVYSISRSRGGSAYAAAPYQGAGKV